MALLELLPPRVLRARPEQAPLIKLWLWLGLIAPVHGFAAHHEEHAHRDVNPWAGVFRAGFQQADLPVRVSGQPVGQHTAG
jgi:hypothetical protein